ncbi:tuftelin-interacting protein 11 [Marchantia polymorpha subsp. ruderalis]
MDEYQHMERFSMENDYTDGQWVGGEYFYRKRKEKHNQTKEEALYGVFEESDSDEDSSKRRRRGDLMKKSDLTKPVAFVSTGIVQPAEEAEKVAADDEEAQAERPGLGSGSSGFKAAMARNDEDEDQDLLPTAFGRQILEAAERRQRQKEKAQISASTSKASEHGISGGPEVGTFEKHTKGIGLKLLEKMGYKGGGLGKNQQGIAAPIEAKLRPVKMGMGFNDFRETSTGLPPAPGGTGAQEMVKEVKEKPKEKLWHVRNRNKKNKDYVTASELLSQKQGVETVQTVLDMRGPQVRVLTNLESLNAENVAKEENRPMPELQHNIRLIVDLAEAEIQVCDRKLAHERDSIVILKKETERLQIEVATQKQQIDVIETIMGSIQKLQEKIAAGGMSLESMAGSFATLQARHREDYKVYDVGIIALSYVLPSLVSLFRGWEPLQHPRHGIEIMSAWQGLLQGDEPKDYSVFPDTESAYGGTSSPYTQLVMEAVMPAVRTATTNFWEPRDPEPMLRFLEAWDKLLPSGILQNILEQLVMPKLSVAVDMWDPRQETVPIHAWLHPWLPLLGSRMEGLYLPIRYKLTTALQAWHPSDTSAYSLLSPWQAVFDAGSWEQLLVRSIMPKLMYALQELVVNPAHQQLEEFNWVMAWATALPAHHMAGMLESGFFPKWQQVLYHWLCSNPNFDEVTQWYLGWKSLFPAELLANERIRRQLNVALDMMNQAVEGAPVVQPGARENVSYLRVTEQRHFEFQQQAAFTKQQQQHAASTYGVDSFGTENISLKEIVEGFAQDNDIQFVPKLGRVHEGLQVYAFGAVSVCVDTAKQKLVAQTGDTWVSVSLDQLLEMNRSRSGRRWK